jgi:hypothetical protein
LYNNTKIKGKKTMNRLVKRHPQPSHKQPEDLTALFAEIQVEGPTSSRTVQLPRQVRKLMTSGEQLLDAVYQRRLFSPFCPDLLMVTNRRVLLCKPGLFGRMNFVDFLWQNEVKVHVETYMLCATLTITANRRLADGSYEPVQAEITGLEKTRALEVYAEAQKLEQEWHEKLRIRKLEEDRSKSGGVYIAAPFNGASSDGAASSHSIETRLARLKHLNQKALLSDAEYEARKAQIIGEI